LYIGFEFEDVNEILSLVGEFFFEIVNLFRSSWVFKLVDDVEEHGVLVRLLHDFSNLIVEIS
jgi:hypothetical protein